MWVHIDARGADPGAEARVHGAIAAMGRRARDEAVRARLRIAAVERAIVRAAVTDYSFDGEHCLAWAASAVEDISGRDPVDPCVRLGYGGVAAIVMRTARRMNWQRIAIVDALPGDVGVFCDERTSHCALRHSHFWVARTRNGVFVLPPAAIRMAWRV